jgi:hypothetical protein
VWIEYEYNPLTLNTYVPPDFHARATVAIPLANNSNSMMSVASMMS